MPVATFDSKFLQIIEVLKILIVKVEMISYPVTPRS